MGGVYYDIELKVIPGDNKKITRVVIKKNLYKKKDFFTDREAVHSDGYEEKALLYRIKQELIVERQIKKQARKKKKSAKSQR